MTFWQEYDKAVIMVDKSKTEKKTGKIRDFQDTKGRFKPGNHAAASRKGRPNKVPQTIKQIFSNHFFGLNGGDTAQTLNNLYRDEPAIYWGIIKELLPKRIEVTGEDGGPVNIRASLDLAAKNMKPYGPID